MLAPNDTSVTQVSAFRRGVAAAISTCYGYLLFVLWFCPALLIATHERGGSDRRLWMTLGAASASFFVVIFLLPKNYFQIWPFERDGRVYRRLGVRRVRYFAGHGDGIQKLVRAIDPNWQCPLAKLSTEKWMEWTRTAEWVHIAAIGMSIPLIGVAYYRGFTSLATVVLLSNIPFNVYPVLLQRYTRAKLSRIQECELRRADDARPEMGG